MTNRGVRASFSDQIHRECPMMQIKEKHLASKKTSLINHKRRRQMTSSKRTKRELLLAISFIMMRYLNFFARKCLSRNRLKTIHQHTLTNTSKIWWLNKMPSFCKIFKNGRRPTVFQLISSTRLKTTTIIMKVPRSLLLCRIWTQPMRKEKTWSNHSDRIRLRQKSLAAYSLPRVNSSLVQLSQVKMWWSRSRLDLWLGTL